ncbi:MAG: helix-turn-helix domain-containing protein [Lachnospiraceae bacterium]|nr:helix-turn-helix domain-containing protein [Lachnospiraceae bacterium]
MHNIGDTLTIIRREQNVSQEKLCLGLCSKTAYSRFELGDRIPDRLLLNTLLERLGKDAGKLSTVMQSEEYAYFIWRRSVAQAVAQKDITELETLLKRPEAVVSTKNGNKNLQQQFLYRMNALIADMAGQPIQETIDWLRLAIETTLPEFTPDKINSYLISISELHVLTDLAEVLLRAKQTEDAGKLLVAVVGYATFYYQDPEARVKVIPRATLLLAPILMEKGEYLECMRQCAHAVELLRSMKVLYDLAGLMDFYLQASSHSVRTETTARYEKQLAALRDIYQEYDIDPDHSPAASSYFQNQDLYLISEVIRSARIRSGLSQEEASEGICTPENYSRIETGRHSPNIGTYRALMEKLDVDADYFESDLDTSDFMLLEKKREMDREESLDHYQKARILLTELQDGLREEGAIDRPRNRQILMAEDNLIRYAEKMQDEDQFMRQCEIYFGCENEGWLTEQFWNQFLTKYKVKLLNQLALIYAARRKDYTNGIYIWEHILNWLKDSKISLTDRFTAGSAAMGNLSLYYGGSGRHAECIRMCEERIRLSLSCGRGLRLGRDVMNKAEALIVSGSAPKKACEKNVQQAFYLNDLLGPETSIKYADHFYRENYESNVLWY